MKDVTEGITAGVISALDEPKGTADRRGGGSAFARSPSFRRALVHRPLRRDCRCQRKRRTASVISAAPGSVHVFIMRRSGGCAARGCAVFAVDLNDYGFLVVVLLGGLAVVGVARGRHLAAIQFLGQRERRKSDVLGVAIRRFPFSRSILTERTLGKRIRKRTLGNHNRDRVPRKRNRKRTGSCRKRTSLKRTGSLASSCGLLLWRMRRRA